MVRNPSWLVIGALGLACTRGGRPFGEPDAAGEQPPQEGGLEVEPDVDEPDLPPEPDGPPPGPATCDDGSRTGAAGKTDGVKAGSIAFNVRAPASYSPTIGSPLIVMFAPAGADRTTTETFVVLTPAANSRGYVIAYVDHISPSSASTGDLGQGVVKKITETWCVDPGRIYLSGHSDGASLLTARMVARISTPPVPAAVAPSATGWPARTTDPCPPWGTIPAMVIHSKDDALFPGIGLKIRDYFVRCNECGPTPKDTLPNGCVPYAGCKNGADVQYCEKTGAHGIWQKSLNASILDFFDAHRR